MRRWGLEVDWFSWLVGVRFQRFYDWRPEKPEAVGWELELCLLFLTFYLEGR